MFYLCKSRSPIQTVLPTDNFLYNDNNNNKNLFSKSFEVSAILVESYNELYNALHSLLNLRSSEKPRK